MGSSARVSPCDQVGARAGHPRATRSGAARPVSTNACLDSTRVLLGSARGRSARRNHACSADHACRAGSCVPGLTLDCDDGDACTADGCDGDAGCINEPIAGCCLDAGDCDDGDPCTEDYCSAEHRCGTVDVVGCRDDAGPPAADGGVGDAAVDAAVDAEVSVDAATGDEPGSLRGGGLGCHAGPGGAAFSPWFLSVMAALVLWRRRRQR